MISTILSTFNLAITIIAFIGALSILVIVHEYGHYRMALACGVKVIRFSIGFGKPFYTWKLKGKQTQFALAPFPFGGYVRMLSTKDEDYDCKDASVAFDNKPLISRTLVILAGPVANLVLAVVLMTIVTLLGTQHFAAKLSNPIQGSMLEKAGIVSGDRITGLTATAGQLQEVASIDDFYILLYHATASEKDARLQVRRGATEHLLELPLPLSTLGAAKADNNLLINIGFDQLWRAPAIAKVFEGTAAEQYGLKEGDFVKSIDGQSILDGYALFDAIASLDPNKKSSWVIERDGSTLTINLFPREVKEPLIGLLSESSQPYQAGLRQGDVVRGVGNKSIYDQQQLIELFNVVDERTENKENVVWTVERDGRLLTVKFPLQLVETTGRRAIKMGISISSPEVVTIQHGLFKSMGSGLSQTWFISRMLVTSIGNMIVGKAKVKDNLSGPLQIAQYAGEAARRGLPYYIKMLALLSISLGLLNLLPLPVLDGGHLLLYLIEAVRRKPISDRAMQYFQQTGILLLLALMLFVTFNDILRLSAS